MSIEIKKTKRVSLASNINNPKEICFGVHWDNIETKGFFGGKKVIDVDLDLTACMFDHYGIFVDKVYYSRKRSSCNSMIHNRYTDQQYADEHNLDHEVVLIHTDKIPHTVANIAIAINGSEEQGFNLIPSTRLRIYEGQPNNEKEIHGQMSFSKHPSRIGNSMVMGKLARGKTTKGNPNDEWYFEAIGEVTKQENFTSLMKHFQKNHL
jgi:tellurium resistance protein TerZ